MFTLFYSALSKDQHIRNAIVLGLPIDSHASGAIGWMYQRIADVAGVVRKRTGFKLHDLQPHWFYTPGWANTLGFKLTNDNLNQLRCRFSDGTYSLQSPAVYADENTLRCVAPVR